ncbi:sulfotransferase 2A8-like [Dermacentor variabilis]|uniref:sulfotransferase 2A8-like n=1 Tax=Dermacentor variabilis TaxID=34621 RepID=UPI003F5B88E6
MAQTKGPASIFLDEERETVKMTPRRPHCNLVDGMLISALYDPQLYRKSMNFRAKKGDLVLFTFPKSGTHWVAYIMQLILKRGQPIKTYREFTENMRILEVIDLEGWKPSLPMRIVATRPPPRKELMSDEAKYVYVARNPWDVCVSAYNMFTTIRNHGFGDATFEEFVDAFLAGELGYGNFFDHVAAGYALRDEPNVFFVTYEELASDTRGTVLRLARFLGQEYAAELEGDEAMLEKLLERCKADYMRDLIVIDFGDSSGGEWERALARLNVECQDFHRGKGKKFTIVRKGKVGDWKTYFTPKLLVRMEVAIREAENKSSVTELWKNMRDEALMALDES